MNKLIKLTCTSHPLNGPRQKELFNPQFIVTVLPREVDGSYIETVTDTHWVEESFEEIEEKLFNSSTERHTQ